MIKEDKHLMTGRDATELEQKSRDFIVGQDSSPNAVDVMDESYFRR
jgi:hypothetical protein